MVPWNSFPLEVSYQVLGWLAFLSWGVAGYPQLILNFRRKRLSFSCSILIFCCCFSSGGGFLNGLVGFCDQTQCGGIKFGFSDSELNQALFISHIQCFPLL